MPKKESHLAAVEQNKNAIDCFRENLDRFPEWITVVAFYTAVHLVEALFAVDSSSHSRDHATRNDTLLRNPRYRHIWKHYKPIWLASLVARYREDPKSGNEYTSFVEFMSPREVEQDILNHDLCQIENSVTKLMGQHKNS